MDATRQPRVYVIILLAVMAAVLLPVLALNYLLGLRSLGGGTAVLEASEWQKSTRGITYAPPLSDNRPFKTARLFDRLPEIDTVVLGSSTAMGITQNMFPEGSKVYNFAQTGNPLMKVVAEAEFLQRTQPKVKRLVIPLDWSLGFVYVTGTPGWEDLVPPTASAPRPAVPLTQQLLDALSLPRVKNLLGIFKNVVLAPEPAAAFRQMFLQTGDDYLCADGTPAKDFDTIFRGTCTGFRYDGSATFANLEPVPARRADVLIANALVPSSKYAVNLIRTGGEPNHVVLERLAALARNMRRAGGSAVLFLPPLLPGLERALLDFAQTGAALRHTKQVLETWARGQDLTIIDAGQSERYGCKPEEFVDEHHALPACYGRVFTRFWSDRSARTKPGLWSGEQ